MKDRVFGRLKTKPEDFIVEELEENWNCSVSKNFDSSKKTDLKEIPETNENKDFLWCEMEKRDIDHFQAIKEVSMLLGKHVMDIGYAGSKDRMAVTSQRISIFKPNAERIKNFHHERIILKNFKWMKRKIKLGYLDGNHFNITVRDVDKKDAIKISNEIRKENWFPNYFGEQRFGTLRENNVDIGKLLIKRKFKEAVLKILTDFSENEREDVKYARKRLIKEKDFAEAFNYFPNFLRLEKQLLFSLKRNPDDFLQALKSGERKNILMFVHSVQSKIFNDILETALEEEFDFTKKGQENCILAGYKTHLFNGRLGEIEKEVLESHDIKLEDFDIREIPYLRIKGSFRKAITEVKELKVEIEDDEDFEGMKKIILSFNLPSGVYATTYLDNFFDFKVA